MQLPEGWESRYDSDTVQKILLGKMISAARGWDDEDIWLMITSRWDRHGARIADATIDEAQIPVYRLENDTPETPWMQGSFHIPVWHCFLAYLISELEGAFTA